MSENPYATPETRELHSSSSVDPERAREIRLGFRGTERLVRSIGLVYFAQSVFLFTIAFVVSLSAPEMEVRHVLSTVLYCSVLGALIGVAGYGLWTLASWSRLCALIQTFVLLGGFTLGMVTLTINSRAGIIFVLLHALPFYVLFAPRAGYVLSGGYSLVVAATPDLRPRSVLLAFVIVLLFAALIVVDAMIVESW